MSPGTSGAIFQTSCWKIAIYWRYAYVKRSWAATMEPPHISPRLLPDERGNKSATWKWRRYCETYRSWVRHYWSWERVGGHFPCSFSSIHALRTAVYLNSQPSWHVYRDTRKIEPLLNHLDSGGYDVTYYSVDLSRSSLARGLDKLSSRYKHVELVGLWGTFEDALPWCQKIDSPRLLISLGSMFGTDRWDDSIRELTAWATLMNPNDRFLIGIDSHADRDKIWASYHDVEGLFEQFIRTGLAYTNDVLGHEWYRDEDWVLEGEFDENPLVHRFVLTASRDVHSPELNLQFKAGSKIECYEGHKYTPNEIKRQFKLSGLSMLEGLTWKSPDGEICKWHCCKHTQSSNSRLTSGISRCRWLYALKVSRWQARMIGHDFVNLYNLRRGLPGGKRSIMERMNIFTCRINWYMLTIMICSSNS